MSLVSEYRKHAEDWLAMADRLPAGQKTAATEVAIAWFRLSLAAAENQVGGEPKANEEPQVFGLH